MKKLWLTAAVAAFLLEGVCTLANAESITTLYDTGVDDSHNVLDNGTVDPHYVIVNSSYPIIDNNNQTSYSSVDGAQTATAWTTVNGFPAGYWLDDDSTSRWIMPTSTFPNQNGAVGPDDYQTTFSLAGFNPSTASITGTYSTDNQLADVLLNGHSLGINNGPTGVDQYQWGHWYAFSIPNGFFQTGVNTLDFIVYNDVGGGGNPEGIRIEMTGTATGDSVSNPLNVAAPVPGSFALLVTGLASFGLFGWMKRCQAKAADA